MKFINSISEIQFNSMELIAILKISMNLTKFDRLIKFREINENLIL